MLDGAQPWLAGERAGLLDAYALTLFRWGGFAGIDPASLPAYRDHVAKVAQQAPFAAVISRERIDTTPHHSSAAAGSRTADGANTRSWCISDARESVDFGNTG